MVYKAPRISAIFFSRHHNHRLDRVVLVLVVVVVVVVVVVETGMLPLAGCQTLLSPVVSCGPPGVVLTRPVILSMDHCSDACPENWAVRLKKQNYEGTWELIPVSSHYKLSTCYRQRDKYEKYVFSPKTHIL
ncbi:hypothetical protein CRUP_035548 [Coryphaenoides rupestris]|nr:hypothetical protein CRUP_035548 [Coryphaenoides rupestris]